MALILDATASGADGRADTLHAAQTTRDRDSVLARYSIDDDGHTTSTRYGRLAIVERALARARSRVRCCHHPPGCRGRDSMSHVGPAGPVNDSVDLWALPVDAYTGHGGAAAASMRDGQRAGVCRGAAQALAAADVWASAERLAEFGPGPIWGSSLWVRCPRLANSRGRLSGAWTPALYLSAVFRATPAAPGSLAGRRRYRGLERGRLYPSHGNQQRAHAAALRALLKRPAKGPAVC
jgi:hypothetical protein